MICSRCGRGIDLSLKDTYDYEIVKGIQKLWHITCPTPDQPDPAIVGAKERAVDWSDIEEDEED